MVLTKLRMVLQMMRTTVTTVCFRCWLRAYVHDGVVQMVATMWMMVMLATMITYAGVVGDEHGDDDGAGNGDDREW